MKLNHDYIRDVLLYVEENLNYDETGNHQNIWFASIPDEEKFKIMTKIS